MVIAFTILTFALKSVILIYFVLSSFLNIHVTKKKKNEQYIKTDDILTTWSAKTLNANFAKIFSVVS